MRFVGTRALLHLPVEVEPSVPVAVDGEPACELVDVAGALEGLDDVVIVGDDGGLQAGGVDPVLDVVGLEHERGGNRDGAHLVERHANEPELVAVLEDQHDEVALAYALGGKVVACLVAEPLDVGEGEPPALAVLVLPDHRDPLGVVYRDVVHDVVTEVEVVGAVDVKMLEETVLVVS